MQRMELNLPHAQDLKYMHLNNLTLYIRMRMSRLNTCVVYYLIEFKELAGLACIETQNII